MDSNQGVAEWTTLLVKHLIIYPLRGSLYNQRRFGFSYVDNCPPTPSATKQLLERISFIRQTHYGKL